VFTGLVRESALVKEIKKLGSGLELTIYSLLSEASNFSLGDSIALNGVCLTLTRTESLDKGRLLSFELSPETLQRSTFKNIQSGMRVHLEPALRMGDSLGGHLVSGHVDGIAKVEKTEWSPSNEWFKVQFHVESPDREKIAPYLVEKGSITVDGVSLTVNDVVDWADKTLFSVLLIPHTLKMTTFENLEAGSEVNLEADMLAKYVSRQAEFFKHLSQAQR